MGLQFALTPMRTVAKEVTLSPNSQCTPRSDPSGLLCLWRHRVPKLDSGFQQISSPGGERKNPAGHDAAVYYIFRLPGHKPGQRRFSMYNVSGINSK